MKSKIIKSIDRISRKRKIRYNFTINEKITGVYYGFNDKFSEFLDIRLIIDFNIIRLYIIPDIIFDCFDKIDEGYQIKIKKLDDNRIMFFSDIIYFDDLEIKLNELYDYMFSKEVIRLYYKLLISNWNNKYSG